MTGRQARYKLIKAIKEQPKKARKYDSKFNEEWKLMKEFSACATQVVPHNMCHIGYYAKQLVQGNEWQCNKHQGHQYPKYLIIPQD